MEQDCWRSGPRSTQRLLAYVGTRAMGALEFAPPIGLTSPIGTAFDLAQIVVQGRNAIAGSFGTEADATAGVRELIQIGSSAGGLRAKAVIAWNGLTGEIQAGHGVAAPGFEHWIIKLDGVDETAGHGRMEYAYALMAAAAGVDVAQSQLLEEGGRAHFLTRRFDRVGNRKVHMQTLCALAHLDYRQVGVHDYAQYLGVVRHLGLGEEAERQAFRRVAFNIMAINRDDHTKNLAFTMDELGEWMVAPAYDLTWGGDLQFHNMSVNGIFAEVTADDLMALAQRFEIVGARRVLVEVADAVESWSQFAALAGIAPAASAQIAGTLRPLTKPRR